MEPTHTPSTLTINLYQVGEDGGHRMFVARSPQFPKIEIEPEPATWAVEQLLEKIDRAAEEAEDNQPLPGDVVSALLEAGYPMDLVEKWHACIRGHARRFRYWAATAVKELQAYASEGVPPFAATDFIAAHWWLWDAGAAGRIYAAGYSAEHVRDYCDWSMTERWSRWDFDVVEWALTGVPASRVFHLYMDRCSSTDAAAWEALVQEHRITDDDLRAILDAEFTVQDFAANQATYAEAGLTAADAARTLLALR